MTPGKAILLVEDDRVDAMAVKRALKDIHVTNRLEIVGNGKDALDFLNDPGKEKPGIILLDLNMPRMNGIEFLEIIRKDGSLKKIPVIVLTTSKDEQDKVDSFQLHVAGYMVKPVDYLQFVEIMKAINTYWTFSELPELN